MPRMGYSRGVFYWGGIGVGSSQRVFRQTCFCIKKCLGRNTLGFVKATSASSEIKVSALTKHLAQQAQLSGQGRGFGAVADAKFAIDAADMLFHSFGRNDELPGDLAVGQTGC
jgi:hypothetical protein